MTAPAPNVSSLTQHGSFDETLVDSTQAVREVAHRLRTLIAEVYPGVVEVPWPKQRVTGYGVGPKKMSEHFCYIAASKHHANLGFYYGAELPDPEGLLQGNGKLLRHVRIASMEDVDRPALRRLLEAASVHRMPERSTT